MNPLHHFGLNRPPFDLNCDQEMLFPGRSFRQVFEPLQAAILAGEKVVKVTGEAGSGKTFLVHMLNHTLDPARFMLLSLSYPPPSREVLQRTLLEELDGVWEPGVFDAMRAIGQALQRLSQQGRRLVLLLDEAQALSPELLEAIRLLGNLERDDGSSLQIILLGIRDLDHHLGALGQRVTLALHLEPLWEKEVAAYLATRLEKAGYGGHAPLFSQDCGQTMFRLTKGNLRHINRIAHRSLCLAALSGKKQVTSDLVRQASLDLTENKACGLPISWPKWLLISGAMGMAVWLFIPEFHAGSTLPDQEGHGEEVHSLVAIRVPVPDTTTLAQVFPEPLPENEPPPEVEEEEDLGLEATPEPVREAPLAPVDTKTPQPLAQEPPPKKKMPTTMRIQPSLPEKMEVGEPAQGDKNSPAELTKMGIRLLAEGRVAEAKGVLREMELRYPNAVDTMQLAAALARKEGRLAEAATLLERILSRVAFRSDLVSELAFLYQKKGDFRQAEALYRQLVEREPNRGNWWLGLGVSLEGMGQSQDAATAFRRSMEDPELSQAAIGYARERWRVLGEGINR